MYLPKEVLPYVAAVKCPEGDSEDDRVFWDLTSNGLFSSAFAYELSCCNRWNLVNPKWRSLWAWKGLEKSELSFDWFFMKGLLTNERRVRRCMTSTGVCERYQGGLETTIHMLRNCYIVTHIWYKLVSGPRFQSFMSMVWEEWFLSNLSEGELVDGKPWNLTFGICCWMVCKWRNKGGGKG